VDEYWWLGIKQHLLIFEVDEIKGQ